MKKENKKIKAYKEICRLADVPKILIEYPELILSKPPDKEAIKWAKKSINQYEKELKDKTKEHIHQLNDNTDYLIEIISKIT